MSLSPSRAHEHSHGRAVGRTAASPRFSLVAASAGQRLAYAALILAALWTVVFWALD